MKQAFAMLGVALLLLWLGAAGLGSDRMLLVVYGALALMAAMIAATFLWLWIERTTPLALGMVFSWSGAALLAGGWWVFNLTGQPGWAWEPHLGFVVQGLSLVGAVMHFSVIHRSFGYHGAGFAWPIVLALMISGLAVAVM